MNVDDLRDVLNEELPEGLDGQDVLAFAHRARTRRRVTAAGAGVTAVVAALVLVWGASNLTTQPDLDIAVTPSSASPSHHSASPTPSVSQPVSTTPTPSVVTSPTPSASQTPSGALSTSVVTTSAASSLPATTVVRSSAPASRGTGTQSAPPVGEKITQLCNAPSVGVDASPVPGILASGGGFTVTADRRNARLGQDGSSATILTVPDAQGISGADTDGRFVAMTVAVNWGVEDPTADLYVYDARTGGQARKLISKGSNLHVTVRDGFALVRSAEGYEASITTFTYTLYDLNAGTSSVIHTSPEADIITLLDGGRWTAVENGAGGVKVSGVTPQLPRDASGGTITPGSDAITNGTSWVYRGGAGGEGDVMVWSPTMARPLRVHSGTFRSRPQIGTNFALTVEADRNQPHLSTTYLVDLRTGARVTLSGTGSNQVEARYQLTSDDRLIRDEAPSESANGVLTQQLTILSGTTVTC